jgi:hypothetical protein
MPNPDGTINVGEDSVEAAGPTPVMPSPASGWMMGATPDAPNLSGGPAVPASAPGAQQTAPTPPPQPTFFHKVIGLLGMGLLNAAQAAITTPQGPQGMAQSAQKAIDLPMQRNLQQDAMREAGDRATMRKFQLAQAQINIQHTTAILRQMDFDYQERADNYISNHLQELLKEGDVETVATGDWEAVHQQQLRHMDPSSSDYDPDNVYFTYKNPENENEGALFKVGGGYVKVTPTLAKIPSQSLDSLVPDSEAKYKVETVNVAPEGIRMKAQDYFKLYAQSILRHTVQLDKMEDLRKNEYTQWQMGIRTDKTQAGANYRTQLATTQRANAAALKAATDQGNKELMGLLKEKDGLIKQATSIGQKQGWDFSGAGAREKKSIDRQIADLDTRINSLTSQPAASNANRSVKVPKGTAATPNIISQYLLKAGGDKVKARQMLGDDGYTIPAGGQK